MISYQLAKGVNAYTVKGMAGHSSVTITEWYSHLATEKNPPLQWW